MSTKRFLWLATAIMAFSLSSCTMYSYPDDNPAYVTGPGYIINNPTPVYYPYNPYGPPPPPPPPPSPPPYPPYPPVAPSMNVFHHHATGYKPPMQRVVPAQQNINPSAKKLSPRIDPLQPNPKA